MWIVEVLFNHGLLNTVAAADGGWGFVAILAPAALADSINPCAFAVMLLLLSSILSKSKSPKKVFFSWLLFILAIFICYFLMGLGVLKVLGGFYSVIRLKIIVAAVWVLVALWNIKDYFFYEQGFLMEMPHSFKIRAQKVLAKVSSPFGAFIVWILVSLLLLPCSSGPYLTILGYLSSQDVGQYGWGMFYLFLYNLIFVSPLFVICILVTFWYTSVEKLAKLRKENIRILHLLIWLLMLTLSAYLIYDVIQFMNY